MEEPLYGMSQKSLQFSPLNKKTFINEESPSFDALEAWNGATKKMIIAGVLPPDPEWDSILDRLMEEPSVILLTEKNIKPTSY